MNIYKARSIQKYFAKVKHKYLRHVSFTSFVLICFMLALLFKFFTMLRANWFKPTTVYSPLFFTNIILLLIYFSRTYVETTYRFCVDHYIISVIKRKRRKIIATPHLWLLLEELLLVHSAFCPSFRLENEFSLADK